MSRIYPSNFNTRQKSNMRHICITVRHHPRNARTVAVLGHGYISSNSETVMILVYLPFQNLWIAIGGVHQR
jgi:hypothetical protein